MVIYTTPVLLVYKILSFPENLSVFLFWLKYQVTVGVVDLFDFQLFLLVITSSQVDKKIDFFLRKGYDIKQLHSTSKKSFFLSLFRCHG